MSDQRVFNMVDALWADDFVKSFTPSEESEFVSFVKEFDAEAEWRTMHPKYLQFIATGGDTIPIYNGDKTSDLSPQIAVRIGSDEQAYTIRYWADKSLKNLIQDNPTIFKRFAKAGRYDTIAERLNQDVEVLRPNKKVTLLVRGGKISGAFGEFNKKWTQADQIEALRSKIGEMFRGAEFAGASVSHIETRVLYRLNKSVSRLNIDISDLCTAENETIATAAPLLEFYTGDSGLAQISLMPWIECQFEESTVKLPIGAPVKVRHRGPDEVVWGTFMENIDNFKSTYQDGLYAVSALAEIQIDNPRCCVTNILKKFSSSVPVSECKALATSLDKRSDCTAFTILATISTMLNDIETKFDIQIEKRVSNIELASRLLSREFNWAKVDIPD